jgi:hypothetical protein
MPQTPDKKRKAKPADKAKGYSNTPFLFNQKFKPLLESGIKVKTNRVWTDRTTKLFQARLSEGRRVKAVSNYSSESQFGWIKLSSITPGARISDILDEPGMLRSCGEPELTKKEYIQKWCKEGGGETVVTHITFTFEHM